MEIIDTLSYISKNDRKNRGAKMSEKKDYFKDKIILVTGGVGSIGKEIVKKALTFNPSIVRILDINETGLFQLDQELNSDKLRFLIGDVRDKDRLKRAMEDVDIVLNAAALKHVPLCEYNPFEAVKTNVIGTQNLIEVAMDEEVEKFITISTDKAVNPVSVMGATKLLGERLTISANYYKGTRKTAFSCVRFGNVLGSRGSVVPLFKNQILLNKMVTITDPSMTRFIMSIQEAVDLIFKVTKMSCGGEIFILKMPAINIQDLVDVMIDKISQDYNYQQEDIKINIIGKRAGEKKYEELMIDDEALNALEDDDLYIVLPRDAQITDEEYKTYKNYKRMKKKQYTSKDEVLLTRNEIKALLQNIDL